MPHALSRSAEGFADGATQAGTAAQTHAQAQMLSAWLDGAAQEPPPYVLTAAGRATWDAWHLIGDVMRTPELATAPSAAFGARLAQALAHEPAHCLTPTAAPQAARAKRQTKTQAKAQAKARLSTRVSTAARLPRMVVWPSLALAASVALAVWLARPLWSETDVGRSLLAGLTASLAARDVALNEGTAVELDAGNLAQYLEAHRQLVGPSAARQVSEVAGLVPGDAP